MMWRNLFFVSLLISHVLAIRAAEPVKPDVAHNDFVFPATGISVTGEAMLLAIDDVSLPLRNNLCYYSRRDGVPSIF